MEGEKSGGCCFFCWFLALVGAIVIIKKLYKLFSTIFKCTVGNPTRALQTYKPRSEGENKKPTSWAVVTGASMGIGRADAEVLAKAGYNLVLLALEEDKLGEAKKELEEKYGVSVETITINFCEITGDKWAELGKRIAALGDIAVLVNNAGLTVDPPGLLHEVDAGQCERIVAVNVNALTQLTRALMPALLEHKEKTGARALVVTMSSFVSRVPVPMLLVYSASKKYTQQFSMALAAEYKGKVDVISAAPWWVATPMTRIRKANFRTLSPEAFANGVFKFAGASHFEVDPYWLFALFDFVIESVPPSIVYKPVMNFMKVVREAYFRRKKRMEEEANKAKEEESKKDQ